MRNKGVILCGILCLTGVISLTACNEVKTVTKETEVESSEAQNVIVVMGNTLNANPITSSDIADMCKTFELTNYGTPDSEIIVESLAVIYDRFENVTKCSNMTSKGRAQLESKSTDCVNRLEVYTEYGKNERGYDTVTHMDFKGSIQNYALIKPYIVKVANKSVFEYIVGSGNETQPNGGCRDLQFDNGEIKITKVSGGYDGSIGMNIDIYYNLDILKESNIDTVRLAQYEPLINNTTFEELENYAKVSIIKDKEVLALEFNDWYAQKYKTDVIKITRDWVKDNEDTGKYYIYNAEKKYYFYDDTENYTLAYVLDVYNKFNTDREKAIKIGSNNADACKELMKNVTTLKDEDLDNMKESRVQLGENEYMTLKEFTYPNSGLHWYLSYGLYDR